MVKIDIVERLRFDAVRCEATFSKGVAGNIEEAADEIERLRAALAPFAAIADHYPLEGGYGMRPRAGDPLVSVSSGGLPDATISVDDLHAAKDICQQKGGEK